jgi:hypothetical protein
VYSPLQAFAAKPLSQADIVRHTGLTNRTAFGLVQACLEAEVPSGLVANVFLYYWFRASTININVPEPFFQTLERHWDMVVERVAALGDMLVHRTRPEAASAGTASRGVPHAPLLRPGRRMHKRRPTWSSA